MNQVSCSENPVLLAAKYVREQGYAIANSGIRTEKPWSSGFGILKDMPRQPVKKGLLFRLGLRESPVYRALYIGDMDVGSSLADFQWNCRVYGREYIKEITNLMTSLAEKNNAKIRIVLQDEEPRKELFSSDGD
mgnify:CR=1 FL=1